MSDDLEAQLKKSLGLDSILEEARSAGKKSDDEARRKRQRRSLDYDPIARAHQDATRRLARSEAQPSNREATRARKPFRHDLGSAQTQAAETRRARVERGWAIRDDYVTRQLDQLEKYTHALEDYVHTLDPDAPLVRGTWRPEKYSSTLWVVCVYRRVARHWQMGSVELRRYMAEKKKQFTGAA